MLRSVVLTADQTKHYEHKRKKGYGKHHKGGNFEQGIERWIGVGPVGGQ